MAGTVPAHDLSGEESGHRIGHGRRIDACCLLLCVNRSVSVDGENRWGDGETVGMVAPLRFTLLGPLRGWRGERELDLGPPQQRAVLAVLLIRQGQIVADSELVDALWPETPPPAALRTLRTYIWRLRKALQTPELPQLLVRADGGYRLSGDYGIDLASFDALVEESDRARSGGDIHAAVGARRAALELWSGPPIDGVEGTYAALQRTLLTERRLVVVEDLLELELEIGRHHEVVGELIALTSDQPLRERLRGLLMVALLRCGRAAEALATHDDLRRRLVTELGIDPGPELGQLRQRIARADPELLTPIATTGGPAQLPPDTPDFTGRGRLLAELLAVLDTAPGSEPAVCALAGIGGIGKTALAVRAGHAVRHRFPGGQLFVDLRGAATGSAGSAGPLEPLGPGIVLSRFLRALGVSESSIPSTQADQLELFGRTLAGRRVLLILDNARDAAQVRPLLPALAGCGVLVTSRAPLDLPGVRRIDVDVLEPDEAVELLERVIGDDRVTTEPAAARTLVEACGFLPLAIRILGSRLAGRPLWSIAAMAARLADERLRLSELRVGDLAVDASFRLGYEQLTPGEARAFGLLAALDVEDIGVAAAAAVLDVPADQAAGLAGSLVDLGLLESPAPGRFRFHDLLRLFARSLPGTGQDTAPARMLDFLLATARGVLRLIWLDDPVLEELQPTTSRGLGVDDETAARAWLLSEWPNLLAMIAQAARTGTSLPLAGDLLLGLEAIAEAEHRWSELAVACEPVVTAAEASGDTRTAARVRGAWALALTELTRLDEAFEVATRAVEDFRRSDQPMFLYDALNTLALIHTYRRDDERAVTVWEESLGVVRRLGNRSYEAHLLANIAPTYLTLGSTEQAVDAAERSRSIHRELGDQPGVMHAEHNLGRILKDVGRHDEAATALRASLALARDLGERSWEATVLRSSARLALDTGDTAGAIERAEQGLALARELGSERAEADTLVILGNALRALGRTGSARTCLEDAYRIYERLELPHLDDVRTALAELG